MTRADHQKGVALLIVLLLLATLSVIAIAMTQTMQRTTARIAATVAVDQARWYGLGAEALARQLIAQQWQADPAKDTKQESWLFEPVQFPIDNGLIEARLRDNTRCFNLNSLVTRDSDTLTENPQALEEFAFLLKELGYDGLAQNTISRTITDWIDTDTVSGPDGAEDGAYGRLDVPYRTGNALLSDISELRAVMWMSPDLYTALKPHVCVQPRIAASPVNINLATPADVPVIRAIFGETMQRSEVESLIGQIPAEGFPTIDALWTLPVFNGKDIPDTVKERFILYSKYLILETNVNYNQAFILQKSLLEVNDSGGVSILSRKIGPDA